MSKQTIHAVISVIMSYMWLDRCYSKVYIIRPLLDIQINLLFTLLFTFLPNQNFHNFNIFVSQGTNSISWLLMTLLKCKCFVSTMLLKESLEKHAFSPKISYRHLKYPARFSNHCVCQIHIRSCL